MNPSWTITSPDVTERRAHRLVDHVKLLFEVADLQYASPATVSRCGMVYVDPKNLSYEPYVWKWCNGREDAEEAETLRAMFRTWRSAWTSCWTASTGRRSRRRCT